MMMEARHGGKTLVAGSVSSEGQFRCRHHDISTMVVTVRCAEDRCHQQVTQKLWYGRR